MLSIIVPAYQAESFLEKSIASILENTYDIEVLIINDGSMDGTENICQQISSVDSRVRYWTKENEGPGAAREFALRYAKGDYITFVDADDYVDSHAYDSIMSSVDESLDIIEFGYRAREVNGRIIREYPLQSELIIGNECGLHYARQKNTTNFLWNKIFKRELFNCVSFPRLYAAEDAAVLAQLYVYARRCVVIEQVMYNYVMTPDSLCRKPFTPKKLDNVTAYKLVDEFYKEMAPDLCFYSRQKICSLAALLYCEIRNSQVESSKELSKKMIAEYREARKGLSFSRLISHGSKQRRIMLSLFEVAPSFCALVYARRLKK